MPTIRNNYTRAAHVAVAKAAVPAAQRPSCARCGHEMRAEQRKYCGMSCAQLSRAPSPKVAVPCTVCAKEFQASAAQVARGNGRYCSQHCVYIARKSRLAGGAA